MKKVSLILFSIIILYAIFVCIGYILSYYTILHSDAYSVASSFIRNDVTIKKNIGDLTVLEIPWNIKGCKYSVGQKKGEASLRVLLKGTKGRGEVLIKLVRSSPTKWEIVDAQYIHENGISSDILWKSGDIHDK